MSGCSLRCVRISTLPINERASTSRPSRSLSGNSLQDVGHVYNIKIVTLEHVVPPVALSILRASDLGLWLSIVYDTSSFDSLGSLRLMDGLVDIYLADFKVWDPSASRRLLKADDYDATARESVCAMQAQGGNLCFTADGIAKRGLLVRHLAMPGRDADYEISSDRGVDRLLCEHHGAVPLGRSYRQGEAGSTAVLGTRRRGQICPHQQCRHRRGNLVDPQGRQ